MQQVREIIEQVADTLTQVAQSDVVVGAPLELGGVTVVPISRVSAGFGGGGGEGRGDSGREKGNEMGMGRGGGSGGGALVRPVAVVVFGESGIEVMPIPDRPGKLEKLLDQIPTFLERFKDHHHG